MRFRIFSLLVITLVLGACDTDKTAVEKTVVGLNATDDQKFAYMLGAQFGAQFAMIAKQFEAPAEEELFILGSSEAQKMMIDTSFHLQLPDDTLRLVGQRFQENARKLQEIAKTSPTPPPVKPEIPALNKYPATISLTSSDNDKFAYMLGVQFGTQFVLLGKEFKATLDEKFFIQGIRDARVMRADSTQHMQLSEDTLRAVSTRYQKKTERGHDEKACDVVKFVRPDFYAEHVEPSICQIDQHCLIGSVGSTIPSDPWGAIIDRQRHKHDEPFKAAEGTIDPLVVNLCAFFEQLGRKVLARRFVRFVATRGGLRFRYRAGYGLVGFGKTALNHDCRVVVLAFTTRRCARRAAGVTVRHRP